jgi:hypothetical protein
MSDIVIVSRDTFRNGWNPDGHVPYGSILDDSGGLSESHTIEGIQPGAVAAVDWRGIDQVDTPIGVFEKNSVKRGPGRPRKVN